MAIATHPSLLTPGTNFVRFPTYAGGNWVTTESLESQFERALAISPILGCPDALRATLTATNSGTLTCANPSLTLTATTSDTGLTYVFTGPSGVLAGTGNTRTVSAPGTYSVTVSGLNGCTVTARATTTVFSQTTTLSLTASTTGLSCSSPSALLTASSGFGSYVFAGPGLSQSGPNPTATTSQSGVFSVTATLNSCSGTASVMLVNVPAAPLNALLLGQGNLNCTTPTLTLTATGGTTYQFSGPAGGIVSQTNGRTCVTVNGYLICSTPIPTLGTAVVSKPGFYTVLVTNESGCTATQQIQVTGTECRP